MQPIRNNLRVAALALSALLVFAACGGGGSSPGPEPAAGAARANPPAEPAEPTPIDEPEADPGPQSTWAKITDGIGDDGTIPKEVALQAFELVFGDLPDVELPEADPGAEEPRTYQGSAMRWIQPHLDDLTPEQRDAIHAEVNGPTAPAAVPAAAATGAREIQLIGTRPTARQRVDPAPAEVSCTVGDYLGASTTDGESYRHLLDQEQALLEGELGFALGVPVHIDTGPETGDDLAWASVQAHDCDTQKATSCHVRLFPNNLMTEPGTSWRRVLVHELFHCYQGRMLPVTASQARTGWIVEGFADFVAQDLHPEEQYRDHFKTYLDTPGDSLFGREYDAVGFFFHLKSFGGDPWGNYIEAFRANGNEAQFDTIVGSARGALEETWASASTMQPARGPDWTEPEAPSHTVNLTNGKIVNGGSWSPDTLPYSNEMRHVDIDADIITFQVSGDGYGRLGWDNARDDKLTSISDVNFCTFTDGCPCPDGTDSDSVPAPALGATVALSGIEQTTFVEIIGSSVEDICNGHVDPCTIGVWEALEWTREGPSKELNITGGSEMVMIVEADGTITWDFDFMDPMTNTVDLGEYLDGEDFLVLQAQVTRGVATGKVKSKDEKWTTTEQDIESLSGLLIDEIAGELPMASPGPGSHVIGSGRYECKRQGLENQGLTLLIPETVEGKTIRIPFKEI